MLNFNEWKLYEYKVQVEDSVKPVLDILNNEKFKKEYLSKNLDALDISEILEEFISKKIIKIKDDSKFNFIVDILCNNKFKRLFKPLIPKEGNIDTETERKIADFVKLEFNLWKKNEN